MDGPINTWVARCWRAGTLAAALLPGASSAALAQGITVLQSSNDSLGNGIFDTPDYAVEFRSSLVVDDPLWEAGTASVRQHLSWLSAVSLKPNSAEPGVGSVPNIGWSLKVRVDDPFHQGFALVVDHKLRGLLSALRSGGINAGSGYANTELSALQPLVSGTSISGVQRLPGISTPNLEARWDELTGNDRRAVDWFGTDTLGTWFGTQVFTFQLEPTRISSSASQGATPPGSAAAWQQFGRSPILPSLDFVLPGPGDRPLEELGQFFQVSAVFMPAAVPEPGSWALLAAGLGLVLLRWRHGAAGTQHTGATA